MAKIILALFALAAFTVVNGQVVVENYAYPPVAKPGENVTFYCQVDQDILSPTSSFCQWAKPGGTLVLPGVYPNDEYEFIKYPEGSGKEKRRCDFVLTRTQESHNGLWQCQPNLNSGPISQTGLRPFNFVVAAGPEPKRPVLLYNGEEFQQIEVDADDEVALSCNLYRTRPKPKFTWYKVSPTGHILGMIDGAATVEHEQPEPGTDGLKSYNSTIRLLVRSDENAIKIRCVVNHTMLQDEGQNHTDVTLSVQGLPTRRQCGQVGSGISVSLVDGFYCDQNAYYLAGKDGFVEVVFSSNPEPRKIEWFIPKFGQNALSNGEEREGYRALHWERFQVHSPDPVMQQFNRPDLYSAKLEISKLMETVAGKYVVMIYNGHVDQQSGDQAAKFMFTVQIGEKPPAPVSTGLVVGIVVGIVLLALLAGLIFFAWRKNLLCFKARAPKPEGDTESAEHVKVSESNGKEGKDKETDGKKEQTATPGTKEGAAAGFKTRLSKFLPKTSGKKNKDGTKAEKVPLDERKTTDVESGLEGKDDDGKAKEEKTLIYADLDLIKNTNDGPGEKTVIHAAEDKTEYAQIVGTVNDLKK